MEGDPLAAGRAWPGAKWYGRDGTGGRAMDREEGATDKPKGAWLPGQTAERGYYATGRYVVVRKIGGEPSAEEARLLAMLYDEASTQWRGLHEVRFKLLGLLPLATVGVLGFGLGVEGVQKGVLAMIVSGLGFGVTRGLQIYDRRNSELYNALISRGRRIEAEMGVVTGVYLGRPSAETRAISHGVGTAWVYNSVKYAWAAAFVAAAVQVVLAVAAR
ncbi:hypothetical protein [Algicella marina]|uniref:Uncharacterized protein n=1 Tax=Algicella marina TaxID=2683284 RepID=A0A6P1T2L0_9RHOB|nr:hypothetical protein [Algicella marina]QHQ35549.1 hypothetical protein GO499_10335 [Algicella marina]